MIQLASDHGGDLSVDATFGKLEVGYELKIARSQHIDFSDVALEGQDLYGVSFGHTDPGRISVVSRAYTLAFFEKHLLGESQPLLDGPSPDFPDVYAFQKRP